MNSATMSRVGDNINKTINNNQKSNVVAKGIVIWGITTIFYFFDNLLNASPGAMKPELSAAFSNAASDIGILSAAYLWVYGVMQIPAGLLMDRFGPRRMLTLASFFCAIGCLLFAKANTLSMAILGRGFIGFGASFAVIGCSKVAISWFPPKRFALFIGLMVSVGMTGPACSLATVNKIIQMCSDWREAMLFAGCIALLLAIALWLIVRDKPANNIAEWSDSDNNNNNVNAEISVGKALVEVVCCRQAWYASTYAGFMFVPTLTFGAMWGVPYLVEAHGFSRDTAGILAGLIFIGWVFGGPIYGWFSDYIGKRNLPMYFANIATLIISLVIIHTDHLSVINIGILMFLLGFVSSGFILAFAVMREKNRPEVSGTAIGFINTLNTILGGALFQCFIGKVLDWVATDAVETSAGKIFSLTDYSTALLVMPISLVISFIMLVLLKETYCK